MDDEKPKWPVICSPQDVPAVGRYLRSLRLDPAATVQGHPWLPEGTAIVVNPGSEFLAPDLTTPRILDYGWAMPLFAPDAATSSLLREQYRYQQYLAAARLVGVDLWAARLELLDVYEELRASPVYFDPFGRALYQLADRELRAYWMRRSWTRPPRLCIDGHAYRRRQRARRRRKP